jgi:hypothetical protein
MPDTSFFNERPGSSGRLFFIPDDHQPELKFSNIPFKFADLYGGSIPMS